MLRFNHILQNEGLEPTEVAVILHTPKEPKLRRHMPLLARESPELFEAYQASHSANVTATLRKRQYLASFVEMGDGSLILAGIYRNLGVRTRSSTELLAEHAVRALIDEFGAYKELDANPAGEWPWFTFQVTDFLAAYVGRLRIAPRLTQTYVRLAEKLDAEIVAIERKNVLDAPMPPWEKVILSGAEVRNLPKDWVKVLQGWRGVYLIEDQSTGGRYVGSAYGEDNLWGRWRDHVAQDKGITARLKLLDPKNFQFSILERVVENCPPEDVIRLERNWIERLDTIKNGLNH